MKMTIKSIVAAVVISASPAVAQDGDVCSVVGQMAYDIMEGRQGGIPMSNYMTAISRTDGVSAELLQFMRAVVLDAYDEGRYVNYIDQVNAAEEFRNDVESICYQAM